MIKILPRYKKTGTLNLNVSLYMMKENLYTLRKDKSWKSGFYF